MLNKSKPLPQLLALFLAATLVSGCGLFRVEIQQGNYVTKEQVRRLRPGMTKDEVSYVMGTPLVVDPFHAKTRWDYYFAYSPNLGADFTKHRITLFFKNRQLTRIAGDSKFKKLAEAFDNSDGATVSSQSTTKQESVIERTLEEIVEPKE